MWVCVSVGVRGCVCSHTATPVGYLRAALATAQPPNTTVYPLLGFHHYRALPEDGHSYNLHCAFPLPRPVSPRMFQYHQADRKWCRLDSRSVPRQAVGSLSLQVFNT